MIAVLIGALAPSSWLGAQARPAQIRVSIVGEGRSRFIERSIWYVSLDGRARPGTTRVRTLRGTPGRHVLRSYVRPTDGNCVVLGAPTGRCSAVAHQCAGRPCRIEVRG